MTKRQRIVMIYPMQGFSGVYVRHIPLGLLYASSNLVKQDYDVKIFDARLHPKDWREKLAEILTAETVAVGFSVMSGTPIKSAQQIGRFVKSIRDDIAVIWGGPHATFNPMTILEEPSADFALAGYAAETFPELINAIVDGRAPANVPGAYWRDDTHIECNDTPTTAFEYMGYEDIPYHLIEDYSVYGQLDQDKMIFSMYSAVGCPYQCTFCSSPAQYSNIPGKKWVPLGAKTVVNHIQYVVENHGANYIYFIDDDSFPRLDHVEAIIDEIAARGINVKLGFRGARINEIKRMSDKFLTKLANAGTDILHIGAECGSDRILKLLKKNSTYDDIIECNRKLSRHPEITAAYNFMMGVPTETKADLLKTRDLMLQLVHDHPNCIIFPPNKFRPLPGTELYDIAQKEYGYEMPSTLEAWSNIEVEAEISEDWYDRDFRKFCDLLLVSSYFVDNKIMKVTEGKTLFYKFVRLANLVYRPFARFRLKHGLSGALIEYKIYRAFMRLFTRVDRTNELAAG